MDGGSWPTGTAATNEGERRTKSVAVDHGLVSR
jgi:hypothetical protein